MRSRYEHHATEANILTVVEDHIVLGFLVPTEDADRTIVLKLDVARKLANQMLARIPPQS